MLFRSLGREPPLPVGPPSPPTGQTDTSREETLSFVVPTDPGERGPVTVTIDLFDESGRTTVYQARHRGGDRIPAQKVRVASPTTARIYVDGKLRAERHYLP